MNIAYREVRDRVARARADLPSDVERVRINKQSGASLPVAFYGISWDETVDLPRDKLQKHLVRAIERIDGVGVVNVWGQEDREIRIELNRPLAEAAGVNIFQLAQTLTKANFNLASGDIRDPGGQVRDPLAGDLPDGRAARGHDRREQEPAAQGHRPGGLRLPGDRALRPLQRAPVDGDVRAQGVAGEHGGGVRADQGRGGGGRGSRRRWRASRSRASSCRATRSASASTR
jgi:hypothetical protein